MRTYATVDLTKWAVIEQAPFTASGHNEIQVRFVTKAAAVGWARATHGRSWRQRYDVTEVNRS